MNRIQLADATVTEVQSLPVHFSMENLISQAIQKGNIDTLERMLATRRELKAEAALEAFNDAMRLFQSKAPIIKKTKQVVIDGRARYSYAPLEGIERQLNGLTSQCGFCYDFTTRIEDGNPPMFISECNIRHVLGHSKTSMFKVPIDPGGKMNPIQEYGAASTYAKRYSFCNGFGLMSSDEDTDANLPAPTPQKLLAGPPPAAPKATPVRGPHGGVYITEVSPPRTSAKGSAYYVITDSEKQKIYVYDTKLFPAVISACKHCLEVELEINRENTKFPLLANITMIAPTTKITMAGPKDKEDDAHDIEIGI